MAETWARIRRWLLGGVDPAETSVVPEVVAQACAADVVPSLVQALASPSPQVARAAAQALRKLGPEAVTAIPALSRFAGSPIPAGTSDVQHEYARSDALYCLGDLLAHVEQLRAREARRLAAVPPVDRPPPSALEVLLDGTRDPDATVRSTAWVGLVAYVDDPRVRQAASAALDDPDPAVRRQVVHVIAPRPREP
jgi:HEAT repeat protein